MCGYSLHVIYPHYMSMSNAIRQRCQRCDNPQAFYPQHTHKCSTLSTPLVHSQVFYPQYTHKCSTFSTLTSVLQSVHPQVLYPWYTHKCSILASVLNSVHSQVFYTQYTHKCSTLSTLMSVLSSVHSWVFYPQHTHECSTLSTLVSVLSSVHSQVFYPQYTHKCSTLSTLTSVLFSLHSWVFYPQYTHECSTISTLTSVLPSVHLQGTLPGQHTSKVGLLDEVGDKHEENAQGKRNNPESVNAKDKTQAATKNVWLCLNPKLVAQGQLSKECVKHIIRFCHVLTLMKQYHTVETVMNWWWFSWSVLHCGHHAHSDRQLPILPVKCKLGLPQIRLFGLPSCSQWQAASYPACKMQTWPATDKTFLVNGKKLWIWLWHFISLLCYTQWCFSFERLKWSHKQTAT